MWDAFDETRFFLANVKDLESRAGLSYPETLNYYSNPVVQEAEEVGMMPNPN